MDVPREKQPRPFDPGVPSLPDETEPEARDLFEILVRENADMLISFLRSTVRDPATAEDLFQETFLVAWKNLARFDRDRPFGPWLRGIAGRLVMAERRRGVRIRMLEESEMELLEGYFEEFSASQGDTWSEKLEALKRCLERLKPPLREALDLRYQTGLCCRTIAERVGDSLEAVKKRLQRARSYLALCLGLDRPETGDSG